MNRAEGSVPGKLGRAFRFPARSGVPRKPVARDTAGETVQIRTGLDNREAPPANCGRPPRASDTVDRGRTAIPGAL